LSERGYARGSCRTPLEQGADGSRGEHSKKEEGDDWIRIKFPTRALKGGEYRERERIRASQDPMEIPGLESFDRRTGSWLQEAEAKKPQTGERLRQEKVRVRN